MSMDELQKKMLAMSKAKVDLPSSVKEAVLLKYVEVQLGVVMRAP